MEASPWPRYSPLPMRGIRARRQTSNGLGWTSVPAAALATPSPSPTLTSLSVATRKVRGDAHSNVMREKIHGRARALSACGRFLRMRRLNDLPWPDRRHRTRRSLQTNRRCDVDPLRDASLHLTAGLSCVCRLRTLTRTTFRTCTSSRSTASRARPSHPCALSADGRTSPHCTPVIARRTGL